MKVAMYALLYQTSDMEIECVQVTLVIALVVVLVS